jgi:hypothetical protein
MANQCCVLCRFYANPLVDVHENEQGDEFVLHFYDLSAKQPHTMYHFKWRQQQEQTAGQGPDTESTAMET